MTAAISCRQLTRRFGDFTAVDRLTFDIPRGSLCALLGSNGAGKSTTVKMLTGLLAPTNGVAQVIGIDVAANPVALRQKIGVLPETLGLFDDLTVEEHLELTADVYGVPRDVAARRIAQLFRVLSLDQGRRTFASACSHGMRKKTALAMALLPNPEVLFLDEPFEAVDPVTSSLMSGFLARAARRGITVFLTSHILETVERIATQVLIMRNGRIVLNSPRQELTRPLEDLYFELAEPLQAEDIDWLGHEQS